MVVYKPTQCPLCSCRSGKSCIFFSEYLTKPNQKRSYRKCKGFNPKDECQLTYCDYCKNGHCDYDRTIAEFPPNYKCPKGKT